MRLVLGVDGSLDEPLNQKWCWVWKFQSTVTQDSGNADKNEMEVPPMESEDSWELARFVDAQQAVYTEVVAELRAVCKASHWIWVPAGDLLQACSVAFGQVSAGDFWPDRRGEAAHLRHLVRAGGGARLRLC